MSPEDLSMHISIAGPFKHIMLTAARGLLCNLSSLSVPERRSWHKEIKNTLQYAIVWYPSERSAREAANNLHGLVVERRRLFVSTMLLPHLTFAQASW